MWNIVFLYLLFFPSNSIIRAERAQGKFKDWYIYVLCTTRNLLFFDGISYCISSVSDKPCAILWTEYLVTYVRIYLVNAYTQQIHFTSIIIALLRGIWWNSWVYSQKYCDVAFYLNNVTGEKKWWFKYETR